MSNIKPIRPNEPDQAIIGLLESLLEDAKQGKITAIAGVYKAPQMQFAEFFSNNVFDSLLPFIAFLRVLQIRLEKQVEIDPEEGWTHYE